ncbi:MAG: DUF3833 domain-containing protein [Shimia sp.]
MDVLLLLILGATLVVGVLILKYRLASFHAQAPTDYEGKGPRFDIRERLNGPILCEGVIYGPTGRVTSRFVADFDARWEGNTGIMTEHFRYDSGRTQNREWRLTLGNDGRIKAEAADLPRAGRGWQEGNAVQLKYDITLDAEAGGHTLSVTDWMYLVENGTIMNRSQFRKFGIKVAELVATMRPKEAVQAAE